MSCGAGVEGREMPSEIGSLQFAANEADIFPADGLRTPGIQSMLTPPGEAILAAFLAAAISPLGHDTGYCAMT